MKHIISFFIFLLCLGVTAQKAPESSYANFEPKQALLENVSLATIKEKKSIRTVKDAKSIFKENNITNRSIRNINGVEDGYYVVCGTHKQTENLKKTTKKLERKGFDVGTIFNPENKLNYVYLNRYSTVQEVIGAHNTNFDGKYTGKTWVLIIDRSLNETSNLSSYSHTEMVAKNDLSGPITDSLENGKKKGNLITRADGYFNKMWYAEAALLYEEALKDKKNHSFKILQKAGDAHYFNTNMERAYYWYDQLYSNHGQDMSADNLFKYAHSLKGTGKYSRAKRLMRLYNKKIKAEHSDVASQRNYDSKEKVLDKILTTDKKFDIKNLRINTKYSDFSPAFHNDDEVVFASAKDSSFFNTRRYKWNDQPYLDLYVSKINEESNELRNATKFSKKINTKYHEATATFSPDNKTMYFTRNNFGKKLKRDKNGINHLKIYKSNKIDDEWTEAVEVDFNSDDYSTGHPALSPDGKKLYFVSDMPGSIGQTDIFVVDVLENGSFSEPRNLGPEINTKHKEMFPFINNKKLYFSSNGHVGLGGLDVYEAILNEENGFSKVKNVGQPINSKKDDFSYIVNEETQKGFFASNRRGGKGDDDIYSFERLIVEEINENAISGVVTELVTGDVMPEALVVLLDENNIKLKEVTAGDDGSFVFEDLESNTKYILKTVKGEYFEEVREVSTKDNEMVNADISLKKLKELIAIEDGIKKLKTDMIYFDFDRSHIRTDAAEELDKLVEVMNEYEDMVIKIESHTDSRGSKSYNKYLSDKRAKSSRDYLISKGISEDRIESAIGYGEEKLLNECDGSIRCTRQKHKRNRRSEFIIVKM
ncbi:OmpA family protein [Costertonia aggregata]|uniref:OmpA family protein n=1 Tax=Costertonia aggregata TaxID=343403 RepID=A0A7H9APA7_9FLAO|nr:OmpA family protein [Costertonia aggregata]QLG45260.1 OmpA family protein [Costertonia aggregata]